MKTEQEIIEFAKRHAEHEKDDLIANEFRPKVLFETGDGDAPRLVLFPHMDGTDEAYDKFAYAVKLLAAGIDDLESIVFVVDTYKVTQMTKHDGSEWGRGGMQYAWENNTVDKDLVREAFGYQIADKSGVFAMCSLPYTRTDNDVEFHFDEAEAMVEQEGSARFGGFFPNVMREALVQTKLLDAMLADGHRPEDMNLDLDSARLHTMAVTVKLSMAQTEWPCLVPARSEEEAQIIKESMNGGPFSEGIRSFDQDELREIEDLEKAYEQS